MSSLALTGAGPESAAGAAFSPASVAGLQAWYKADAGTSSSVDGAALSQWNDQSGNARHLVQATGTKQPLFKAAIQNGLPVVRFDGVDDFLQAAFADVQPVTAFVVGAYRAAFTVEAAMFDGASAFTNYFARVAAGTMREYAGVALDAAALTPQTFASYSLVYNNASSQFWANGVSAVAGAAGAGNAGGVTLGATATGTNPGAVDVGEFLLYNSILSTTDRQALEAYLRRWGTP